MMAATADFQLGTNGSNITTGVGEASLTKWDNIFNTVPTYDNTNAAYGTLAAKITAQSQMAWTIGTLTTIFGREYIYVPGSPSADVTVAGCVGAGRVVVNSSRAITCFDNVGGQASGTVALTTGQFVRIEYRIVCLATNGIVEAKLYNNKASITPDDVILRTGGGADTGSGVSDIRWGAQLGFFFPSPFWLDQLVGGATAYPGPYPESTTAPIVTGSSVVGSVLSCNGGTWNSGGTFTLTYQWTRDGANIGGATTSTYTSQVADIGHVVGCSVTATGIQATNESATQASSNTISVGSGVAMVPGPAPLLGRFG